MTAATIENLVAAWRRWDDWCIETGHPNYRTPKTWATRPDDPANFMENACKAVAQQLGVPTSRFRDDLMALRRAGVSYRDAIERLVNTT